jgi:hypothetical protein
MNEQYQQSEADCRLKEDDTLEALIRRHSKPLPSGGYEIKCVTEPWGLPRKGADAVFL